MMRVIQRAINVLKNALEAEEAQSDGGVMVAHLMVLIYMTMD